MLAVDRWPLAEAGTNARPTANCQRPTANVMIRAMNLAGPLLGELEFESASTIKILERVPREHYEWRPHAKSMSLGTRAWHIASIPKTVLRLLEAGEFNLENARPAGSPPPDGDPVAEYKRNLADIKTRINGFDDAEIKQPFTLR